MTFQAIAAGSGADIRVNDNFDAVANAGVYGRKNPTTALLVFGYYGGQFNGNIVADGTVTLTASVNNYIVALISSGAVSVSTTTTNWLNSSAYVQLHKVTTNTTGITAWSDYRPAISLPTPFLGGTLTGALNEAPQVTIASSATVAIGAAAANTVIVSGTTTITAFDTIAAGAIRRVRFSGILTLTHNATTLILPGSANITTAVGDVATMESLGSGNWRCVNYSKADGTAVAGAGSGTVTSVAAQGGIETVSGSAITATGTLQTNELINAQTGTTYTYVTGDRGKLVTHSNAASIAGTLPQAVSSFGSGWYMDVKNNGVGTLTITPATSTVDGATTLVLTTGQSARIVSDGANYQVLGKSAGVALGTVNVFTKTQSVTPVTNASVTGTYTPDASASNNFNLTLVGAVTLANPTNLTNGMVLNFVIDQDATGGRVITFGSMFKWAAGTAPTWITTASAKNFFSAYYDGTNLRCGGGAGFA